MTVMTSVRIYAFDLVPLLGPDAGHGLYRALHLSRPPPGRRRAPTAELSSRAATG